MAKLYIEAYYSNGGQKLGNLDGQGILRAKLYKRTKHYKMLSTFPTINNSVAYYKIVTEDGRCIEVVYNLTHPIHNWKNQTRKSAMIHIHKGNH